MLSITGTKYVGVSPWVVVFPSIVVSLIVVAFNLLGDALRDALDPRLRGEVTTATRAGRRATPSASEDSNQVANTFRVTIGYRDELPRRPAPPRGAHRLAD